jgi:hypothetical protein
MVDVIGQYVRFQLPRHWGSGRAAIAVGTHVKLRENNLLGSRHIRYGGYGGIAYHHVADTNIALFTSFITRGVGRPSRPLAGQDPVVRRIKAELVEQHADELDDIPL